MKPKKLTVGVLSLALAAGSLFAAGGRGQAGPGQAGPAERPSRMSSRIRENIITLKLLRMTQALDLTKEQTAVLYPVLTRLENEKYDLTRTLNEAMIELRLLVREDTPDERRLGEALATIDRTRNDIRAKDKEMDDFLKARLSVVQEAKYVLFSVEFYRGLGERLERLRTFRHKNPFTN
jgi:Spy/CpxP family protein refolding chaperone